MVFCTVLPARPVAHSVFVLYARRPVNKRSEAAKMALTRQQVKEALNTVPMDQVLMVPNELTHKQKDFARLIASGSKGAAAYRAVYSKTAKPKTAGDAASRLKRDSRVIAEIEAYRLANEAAKYRTPQQLRELVIHSLVQVVIDPDAKHAQRVQAAKVLGTVSEVSAFGPERREITHIRSAADAKTAIMAKLRELMNSQAVDVTARDADALENELAREMALPVDDSAVDLDETPTPQNANWSPSYTMHSIPNTQSHLDSVPPNNSPEDAESADTENTPHGDLEKK